MRVSIPADIANKVNMTYYERANARGNVVSYCADLEFGKLGLLTFAKNCHKISDNAKAD
jgi:hypothetical protein